MFDSLSDRLAGVFDKLRGRGALSEDDVRSAMREVRVALLEASGLVRGSSGVVDVGVVPVLATSVESVLLRPPVELANSDELVELLDGALLVAAVVSLEELVLEVLGLPSVVVDEVLLDGVLVELAIFAVDPV